MTFFTKVTGWRLWGRRLIIAVLTACLVASLAITLNGLNDNLHPADIAVVLGNKVNRDGTPSVMLKVRLDHAIALYREGYFKVILVSGAQGKEGYSEPAIMRRYLQASGIPHDVIFEDNKGYTTWHTAQNTARFLADHDLNSVLVISQYFHIPRCRLAFSKFGITPIYTSHAPFWSIRDLYSVPRETFGYVAYYLRSSNQTDSSTSSE